jgi:hypothetical protein
VISQEVVQKIREQYHRTLDTQKKRIAENLKTPLVAHHITSTYRCRPICDKEGINAISDTIDFAVSIGDLTEAQPPIDLYTPPFSTIRERTTAATPV